MKHRYYAVASGLFVILLAIGLLVAGNWLAGSKIPATRTLVIVTRGSVMGLTRGSRIFYRGLPVGRVTHLGFNPKNPNEILIHARIGENTPLVPGTTARLATSLFSSSAALSLIPPARALAGPYHPPHPFPRLLTLKPPPLSTLVDQGARGARNLAAASQALRRLLSPNEVSRIRKTLGDLDRNLVILTRIEGHVDAAARELPKTTRKLNALLGSTQKLLADSQRVPLCLRHSLAETRSLFRILAFRTLPRLDQSLDSLKGLSMNLSRLSVSLNRNPQLWLLGHAREPAGHTRDHTHPH
jgi:phospholipid/cholesterol/gamma-HCH transport system substrate-binding protein